MMIVKHIRSHHLPANKWEYRFMSRSGTWQTMAAKRSGERTNILPKFSVKGGSNEFLRQCIWNILKIIQHRSK